MPRVRKVIRWVNILSVNLIVKTIKSCAYKTTVVHVKTFFVRCKHFNFCNKFSDVIRNAVFLYTSNDTLPLHLEFSILYLNHKHISVRERGGGGGGGGSWPSLILASCADTPIQVDIFIKFVSLFYLLNISSP